MVVATSPVEKYVQVKVDHFPSPVGVLKKTHRFQNLRINTNLKLQYHMSCAQQMAFVLSLSTEKLSTKKNSHSKNAVLQKPGCGNSFLAPRYEEIVVPGKQPLLFNSINLKRLEKATNV